MNVKLTQKKKQAAIILAAIIIIAGAWYATTIHSAGANYVFVSTKRGDLTQEIKASGAVKASQELNLAFESSGKVKAVNVNVGDQVKAGQVLAELDNSSVQADLLQSNANIQVAQSQLGQLQAALELQKIKKQELQIGARTEDLQVSQTGVDNAQKASVNAQTNLDNVKAKASSDMAALINSTGSLLQSARSSAYDSVNNMNGGIFNNDAQDPKLTFMTALNTQAGSDAEMKHTAAVKSVDDLSGLSGKLASDNSNYDELSTKAVADLEVAREFLISMNTAMEYVVPSIDIPQTQINIYKTQISASLTSVNANITALKNFQSSITVQTTNNQNLIFAAQAKVDDANSGVLLAQKALDLKKAGATQQQLDSQDQAISQAQASIATQQAQIKAAEAAADKIGTQLDKTMIKAPIDGVITKFDSKIGEEVTMNVPVIGMMTVSKFQVEVFAPETEVSNIKSGGDALITLDAYGSKEFAAKIVEVDPASTVGDGGVPSYKVVLEFVNEDDEIKDGMTANVKISAQTENNVITIPESSVIKDGYDNYVIVYNGTDQGEKRKVELGSVVQNGMVGVVSGLNENDKVADFFNLTK